MTLNADFEVNGDDTVQAHSVAYEATVTLTAVSTEFRIINWYVVATSKADLVAPALVRSGAPNGQIATFEWVEDPGDGLGRSIAVQCIQEDALGNQSVAYRIIGTENDQGEVPFVIGEELWRHATHGSTEQLNRMLNAAGGGGDVTTEELEAVQFPPIVTCADATLTLVRATHAGKQIHFTNGGGCVVTVNSSVFQTADWVDLVQLGAGQVSFDGTATLSPPASFDPVTAELGALVNMRFTSASAARLFGHLELS